MRRLHGSTAFVPRRRRQAWPRAGARHRLAAAGAHVVGFTHDAAEAARRRSRPRRSPAVHFYSGDVASRAATLAMVGAAVTECGAPDLVIHMAGIGGVAEMIDMLYAMFDRMQVNLYGTRHVVEAVLPHSPTATTDAVRSWCWRDRWGGRVPGLWLPAYVDLEVRRRGVREMPARLRPPGVDVACFAPAKSPRADCRAESRHTHPATVALKKISGTLRMDQAIDGLFDGIDSGRFMIVPGLRTRLVHWALRLTPEPVWNAVTDAIVGRALRSAQR